MDRIDEWEDLKEWIIMNIGEFQSELSLFTEKGSRAAMRGRIFTCRLVLDKMDKLEKGE